MTDDFDGIGIIGNRATETALAVGFVVPCEECGELMHVSNASFRDAQKLITADGHGRVHFMCVPCSFKQPPGDILPPGEDTIAAVAERTGLPVEVVRERLLEIVEHVKEEQSDNRDEG